MHGERAHELREHEPRELRLRAAARRDLRSASLIALAVRSSTRSLLMFKSSSSLLTRAACAPLMAVCIRKLQTTNATLPSSEELIDGPW